MNALHERALNPEILAGSLALLLFSSSAIAGPEGQPQWRFELTPYLFAAGLNGITGVRGVTADINVPVEKLVNQLDSAFMASLEAHHEKWLFAFDAFYVRLEGQTSGSWRGPFGIGSAAGSLETSAKQQIYQPSLGYRFLDGHMKLDIMGSARYTQVDTDLALAVTTGGLLPGGARSLHGDESWWDPVVGTRLIVPVAENWSMVGYADVGGFGVGSELSYQLIAGANWQFAKDFSLKGGYRYLHQDFEKDGFVWDMALEGFYVGLGIAF